MAKEKTRHWTENILNEAKMNFGERKMVCLSCGKQVLTSVFADNYGDCPFCGASMADQMFVAHDAKANLVWKRRQPIFNIQEVFELFGTDLQLENKDLVNPPMPFQAFTMIYKEDNGGVAEIWVQNCPETKQTAYAVYAKYGNITIVEKVFVGWYLGEDDIIMVQYNFDEYSKKHILVSDPEKALFYISNVKQVVMICAFAIHLMACKNVSLEEYDPGAGASRQVRRARERKSRPFVKYQILHINPFSVRQKKAAELDATDKNDPLDDQAWCRVRGHFMRATEEKPLFGKPWGAGCFWVGDYVRGNPKFGINVNDYYIDLGLKEGG